MNRTDALPDFVLVHGAYSDETTWAKVSPFLTAAGAKVTTLTLRRRYDVASEADAAVATATVRPEPLLLDVRARTLRVARI